MMIEIHAIQNHSPANINRDDLGAPKTAIFGGVPRARISSQCTKRSIRTSELFKNALADFIGTRTRSFPTQVKDALVNSTIPPKLHKKIIKACSDIAKGEDKESKDTSSDDAPTTGQLIHLAPKEAELFVAALTKLIDEVPNQFEAFLKEPCPKKPTEYTKALCKAYEHTAVDIALFGRMTTSPAFENVEASMQVAHAISTHEVALEVDYFTAVDDNPGERLGAGLVKENQFNSATFYKYFSLDYNGLLRNLNGDADLAEKTVAAFIDAAAKTGPSGKRNSYGNSNLPSFVMVEFKDEPVPTNYANAFVAPARMRTDRDGDHDVVSESIRMLAQYVNDLRRCYAIESSILWCAVRAEDGPGELADATEMQNLPSLITATLDAIRSNKE